MLERASGHDTDLVDGARPPASSTVGARPDVFASLVNDRGETVRPVPRVPFRDQVHPGKLIVFEGIDGSGKSTSVDLAAKLLQERGVRTRSVDLLSAGCRELSYFRAYAENPASALDGTTDQAGLAAMCLGDRLVRIRTEFAEDLRSGTWLLCDRYVFTALAEAQAVGTPEDDLAMLLTLASLFPRPDLGFVTIAPWFLAIERIRQRPRDADKVLHESFYQRAMTAFGTLVMSNDFVELDTTLGTAAIRTLIDAKLDRLFS